MWCRSSWWEVVLLNIVTKICKNPIWTYVVVVFLSRKFRRSFFQMFPISTRYADGWVVLLRRRPSRCVVSRSLRNRSVLSPFPCRPMILLPAGRGECNTRPRCGLWHVAFCRLFQVWCGRGYGSTTMLRVHLWALLFHYCIWRKGNRWHRRISWCVSIAGHSP